MDRPRTGALGMVITALGVLGLSWLALRSMTRAQVDAHADAAAAAAPTTTVDPGPPPPRVTPIPAAIVVDAGKAPIARIDLVLRMDGVDVSFEGAPACRAGNRSLVGNHGAPGSFDEGALQGCLGSLRATLGGKVAVATVTRAGPAVPVDFVDALIAATHRAGVVDVIAP